MTRTKAIQKLEELYARVPRLNCLQKCGNCCEPFRIGKIEWERIERQTGPLHVIDRKLCPMMTDGRCSIYRIRPMICRLWFTVQNNPCPHGCAPDRWLTPEEAEGLLYAANALSGHIFSGPGVEMNAIEQAVDHMFTELGIKI